MKTSPEENPIVAVQYCTGYVDKQNLWRPGFNCTAQVSKQQNSTPLFCCGTSNHKYCCSTKQYIQLGYAYGHNNDVTYGTLLTVVLSTFIFSVMLTVIAFVCCKKFWKSRENLNLELVDDQVYRNTNFLTLNATQLINAHTYSTNGLAVQTQTDAIQLTPTSSQQMNALPQQQTLLSPSTAQANSGLINNSMSSNVNSNNNSNLSAIVTSMSPITTSGQSIGTDLQYSSTNSTQPYTVSNQSQQMNTTTTVSGQSSIAMAGYSVHHPQALQQALIFYEPPPPYLESNELHRSYHNDMTNNNSSNTQQQNMITSSILGSIANTTTTTCNHSAMTTVDLSNTNQATASSGQQELINQSYDDRPPPNSNELPANVSNNIWSQRLLLALGNYRRDCVYPVLDQPRKKLCRTLSQ